MLISASVRFRLQIAGLGRGLIAVVWLTSCGDDNEGFFGAVVEVLAGKGVVAIEVGGPRPVEVVGSAVGGSFEFSVIQFDESVASLLAILWISIMFFRNESAACAEAGLLMDPAGGLVARRQ